MKIDFTITYTAQFDIEQAEKDFCDLVSFSEGLDPDRLMYDTVIENITWPMCVDDLPDEVIETAVTALRNRIDGVQMKMNLDGGKLV